MMSDRILFVDQLKNMCNLIFVVDLSWDRMSASQSMIEYLQSNELFDVIHTKFLFVFDKHKYAEWV